MMNESAIFLCHKTPTLYNHLDIKQQNRLNLIDRNKQ